MTVFTFQRCVLTSHVKLRSLNEKLQMWVFQGQDSAFKTTINISYVQKKTATEIKIPFFFFISNKQKKQPFRGVLRKSFSENMQQSCRRTTMSKCDYCFTLVTNNMYWQNRLNWAFLIYLFAKILYIKQTCHSSVFLRISVFFIGCDEFPFFPKFFGYYFSFPS